MKKRPSPELVDDENPEWTAAMIRRSVRMSSLPKSLQTKLRAISAGRQTRANAIEHVRSSLPRK